EHLGFVVESFGDNTLLVRQVPLGMEQEDIAAMVEEIAQQLLENKHQVGLELEDHILHTMACKAAIKANQKNSQPELQWLVDRLMSGGDIKYCPHGRPVCIEMSKYSIEKQFGRIV